MIYAMNNALDRFFAANPNEFIKRPLDQIVLDPENEEAIKKHIPLLIYELDGYNPVMTNF